MESITPTAGQPFPLFDTVPKPVRNLGISGSIWAPQPQPSETTWHKAIDSFARVNGFVGDLRPEARRTNSYPTSGGREDVFGTVDYVGQRQRDVGAIGDGRKRVSPPLEETHVEQLLRSLNLNSPNPTPLTLPSMLAPPSPTSPNVSPISTTSALLTPTDLSPAKIFDQKFMQYETDSYYSSQPSERLFDTGIPHGLQEGYGRPYFLRSTSCSFPSTPSMPTFTNTESQTFPFFEPFSEGSSPVTGSFPFSRENPPFSRRSDPAPLIPGHMDRLRTSSEWVKPEDRRVVDYSSAILDNDPILRSAASHFPTQPSRSQEPINFLSLLHPSSAPPYDLFVGRIIKNSDQQASIFLQQKLKVADADERVKIVDAICARGFEMMAHRFGNWAVQRCLEATASAEERRKIVSCMGGRVVELATNCYGCHVLQKALDCEEDIRLLIVSELLLGDPGQTLVNKHASHVWSKIMELTWTSPAPPIFAYVNKSLKGKWASLACHETGSLVVQHAFENLEESAKDGIVDELLNQGSAIFAEVAKNQWGSYCIQHILEHGSKRHRDMALDHLLGNLLDFATNEQGVKSITKALKEGGKDTLDKLMKRMCEPSKGGRRATIVDMALSVTGSQLIASVLPNADKDQRAALYDSIRGHIVTLRGCKTGSKVIWLFDRMRAYYGY